MTFTSSLNARGYLEKLKDALDSNLDLYRAQDQERYTGWVIGRVFSVRYYSGKEVGQRFYPIGHKAMGFVKNTGGKAEVRFWVFKGLTDPVSLLLMGGIGWFLMHLSDVPAAWLFALIGTLLISGFTFLCTALSMAGLEGEAQLRHFIRHDGDRYYVGLK